MGVEVAKQIFREDEVVATVNVTVPLHGTGMAAGGGEGADAGHHAHPVGKGGVEKLDEVFADVIAYPFIKDGDEEIAPLLRGNAEIGHGGGIAFMDCGQGAPVSMGEGALYDGCELDVAAADGLEEVVEVERIVSIEVVDYGKGIPLHTVAVE